jgi:excisionase family DNA binding protein
MIETKPNQFLNTTLNPEGLLQAIEILRAVVGAAGVAAPANGGDGVQSGSRKLLTAKQIADAAGIKASWVYEAARRNEVPFVSFGKYKRFDLDEVLAYRKKRMERE